MRELKKMIPDVLKGDYAFIFLFLIYYGTFFIGIRALTAVSMQHGSHQIAFFVKHDMIGGWRNTMLNISSWMLNKGFRPTFVAGHSLYVVGGAKVGLGVPCLGIGILRFWWAIVLAYPQKIRLKVKYFIVGTAGFLVLNIARFTLLAVVCTNAMGTKFKDIDHHFIFNCITYFVLFLFLFKWLKHPILKHKADDAIVTNG